MNLKYSFEPDIEKLYRNSGALIDLDQIRRVLVIFSFLYAVFSISDYYLVNEHLQPFFFIRFGIVIPMFIVTIIATYRKGFIALYQPVLLINFIVAGAGISFMLIVEPDNFIYYGGMFMIYFSGYLLLRLNFVNTVVGGWATLLIYFMGFLVYNGVLNDYLVYSAMFFIGANVIGMIGSYNIETSNRKHFMNNLIISEQNDRLKDEVEFKSEAINTINIEIVFALAKLAETRDKYTGDHLKNVGEYCVILADALRDEEFLNSNFSEAPSTKVEFIEIIRVASALHDVGKVGISDGILKKRGKLTETEFTIMKGHSIIGAEILEKVQDAYPGNEFINMGVQITRHHHERYDGSGYPDGLRGKAIPLCARIMGLCDTYDALTSKRPYKEPFTHETAIQIIRSERGKQFDPDLVDAFLAKQQRFRDSLVLD